MLFFTNLDQQPKNRQSILLVEGLPCAVVLGIVVDDVDLSVVGNPINPMLASSPLTTPPVGMDLNNLPEYTLINYSTSIHLIDIIQGTSGQSGNSGIMKMELPADPGVLQVEERAGDRPHADRSHPLLDIHARYVHRTLPLSLDCCRITDGPFFRPVLLVVAPF